MARKPVVAGRFYPGSAGALLAEIERMMDPQVSREKVIGLISPHAGYSFSGPVAGATLSRIEPAGTFVIMGPNHTGMGSPFAIMTGENWETPLGEVQIDAELGKLILQNSEYLDEDAEAHRYEHSIEVQLPFLQYLGENIKIVPIVLSHSGGEFYKEIGKSIARAVKESGQEVVIMASSDMTHYEPQESARTKDMKAIEAILDLAEDELLGRIREFNITMCGYGPVVSLISAAKELGAREAELVRYQTSGDVTGDYGGVVGYAGVIIK
ncbi:MAG: MEMO1 family protein [Dehalococcoidia bacterium]